MDHPWRPPCAQIRSCCCAPNARLPPRPPSRLDLRAGGGLLTTSSSSSSSCGRNDCGRVPDAFHTVEFEETDASRTRPQPFLPVDPRHIKCTHRTVCLEKDF
eukprot:gene24393-biopygen5916